MKNIKLYYDGKVEFSNDKFRCAVHYFNEFISLNNINQVFEDEKKKFEATTTSKYISECECNGEYVYIAKLFVYNAIALCVLNETSKITNQYFQMSLFFAKHFYCKIKRKKNNEVDNNNNNEGGHIIIENNEGTDDVEKKKKNNDMEEKPSICKSIKRKSKKKYSRKKNVKKIKITEIEDDQEVSDHYSVQPSIDFNAHHLDGCNESITEEAIKLEIKKVHSLLLHQMKGNYFRKYIKGVYHHYQLNNYHLAIENYSQSLKIQKYFYRGYLGRGISYLVLDDYKNAIKDFNTVIKLRPSNSIAYHNLGDTYAQLKDFKRSIDFYEISQEKNPNSAFVYFNIGVSLYSMCDYNAALKYFFKSVDMLGEKYVDNITYNWISFSYENLMLFENAMKFYVKSIEIQPSYDSYYGMGLCNEKLRKFRNAIEYYEKAQQLNSESHEVVNRIGICYWQMSNQLCMNYFARAIEMLKTSTSPSSPSQRENEGKSGCGNDDYKFNLLESSLFFIPLWQKRYLLCINKKWKKKRRKKKKYF